MDEEEELGYRDAPHLNIKTERKDRFVSCGKVFTKEDPIIKIKHKRFNGEKE